MMESKQKSRFVQFALEPLWKVRNPRVRRFCRGILKEGLQGLHWIGAPPPLQAASDSTHTIYIPAGLLCVRARGVPCRRCDHTGADRQEPRAGEAGPAADLGAGGRAAGPSGGRVTGRPIVASRVALCLIRV